MDGGSGIGSGCADKAAVLADSVRWMNMRFMRVLVSFCMCSSRMCIFSSLSDVKVPRPRRLRSFVSVIPNTLQSLSQVAELEHIVRIRRASRINGVGGCPANEKSTNMDNGSGWTPCDTLSIVKNTATTKDYIPLPVLRHSLCRNVIQEWCIAPCESDTL